MSEASCPNFEPRAHSRLTGLTISSSTLFPALYVSPGNPRATWQHFRSMRLCGFSIPSLTFVLTTEPWLVLNQWQYALVRCACARGSKFGPRTPRLHIARRCLACRAQHGPLGVAFAHLDVASRRARAVRAKCSLAGLTKPWLHVNCGPLFNIQ